MRLFIINHMLILKVNDLFLERDETSLVIIGDQIFQIPYLKCQISQTQRREQIKRH